MTKADKELEVIAILCELTDALGWKDSYNGDEKKLAAFKEATRKLTDLSEQP